MYFSKSNIIMDVRARIITSSKDESSRLKVDIVGSGKWENWFTGRAVCHAKGIYTVLLPSVEADASDLLPENIFREVPTTRARQS